MILDDVKEKEAIIKRLKFDIVHSFINSSAVQNKLKMYEESVERLINSDEYKEALKKDKLKKLNEAEKIKRKWDGVSISGGKNPMAWSNRRNEYQKESKKTDVNYKEKWTDNDLEIIYSSDIKMDINNNTFFIPISESKKLKELCKKVGRSYYGVEAHLRNKEVYLNAKEPDERIRPFYKPGGVMTKSAEQIKRVLDKMIKEGKLEFSDDVITIK